MSRIFLLLKVQNQISFSRKSFSIAAITAKHSGAFSFSKAIVKSYSFRRGKYLFQRAFKDISESYGALTVKAARNYGAVAKDPHLVSEPVAKAIFVFIDHCLSLGIGPFEFLSIFKKDLVADTFPTASVRPFASKILSHLIQYHRVIIVLAYRSLTIKVPKSENAYLFFTRRTASKIEAREQIFRHFFYSVFLVSLKRV